jgi:hypothetical protein
LNPLFVNPASHNYHLLVGSPAINTGNPSHSQPTDKDGLKRGVIPEFGAYVYVP